MPSLLAHKVKNVCGVFAVIVHLHVVLMVGKYALYLSRLLLALLHKFPTLHLPLTLMMFLCGITFALCSRLWFRSKQFTLCDFDTALLQYSVFTKSVPWLHARLILPWGKVL